MRKIQLFMTAMFFTFASPVYAGDFQIRGEATLPIPKKYPQNIRGKALQEAKHRAIVNAINKVLGADATSDPAVDSKVDEIVEQIDDSQIVDSKGRVDGDQYTQSVTLVLDDSQFRQLLNDEGIAIHSAAVRSLAILVIMDEYVTPERNLKAPLKDLEEYSSQQGASYSDKSSSGASHKSADASSAKFAEASYGAASTAQRASSSHDDSLAGQMSASDAGQASASGNGAQVNGSYSDQASGSMNARSRGSDSAQGAGAVVNAGSASGSIASAHRTSAAAFSKTNINGEVHDNVSYRHLIEYQPASTAPEKQGRTLPALDNELSDYDIKIVDNDVFRSKYFGNKNITLDQIVGGDELAKYAEYARTSANADFLMVGTSVIVDQGLNPLTGENACTGVMTVKAYSTTDEEVIASEIVSETAAGEDLDACAGNVAIKMGKSGGAELGREIQERAKKSSMYGQEYTVDLTGSSLTLMLKTNFFKALQSLPNVDNVATPRINTDKLYQMIVTYKGTDPLDIAVATALSSNPAFATLDDRSEGTHVVFCMGPCPTAKSN